MSAEHTRSHRSSQTSLGRLENGSLARLRGPDECFAIDAETHLKSGTAEMTPTSPSRAAISTIRAIDTSERCSIVFAQLARAWYAAANVGVNSSVMLIVFSTLHVEVEYNFHERCFFTH